MATPALQNGSSSLRANHGAPSWNNSLYAQMQHAGIGKNSAPDCRIPRTPRAPRAPNQVQQRNIVRHWMGLPPLDSNWGRAGRELGLAVGNVLKMAGVSLAQMAGQATACLDGLWEFSGSSFIPALPDMQIGPPGAAAQAATVAPDTRNTLLAKRSASSSEPDDRDCQLELMKWVKNSINYRNMTTVEAMLQACASVACSDDAAGSLENVTVVLEAGAHLHPLLSRFQSRGTHIPAIRFSEDSLKSYAAGGDCIKTIFGQEAIFANITPGDWAPATGGTIVVLSSQEFTEQLIEMRNVSYASCTADALACSTAAPIPSSLPFPNVRPSTSAIPYLPDSNPGSMPTDVSTSKSGADASPVPAPAETALSSNGGMPVDMNIVKAIGISGAGVIIGAGLCLFAFYPSRSNAHAPAVLPAGLPSSSPAPGGVPAAVSVSTVVPTVLHQITHHDSNHPGAGQPGGD